MSSYEIMYCLLLSLSLSHTHPFSLSLSLTLFLTHTLSLFAYLSASNSHSLALSLSLYQTHTISHFLSLMQISTYFAHRWQRRIVLVYLCVCVSVSAPRRWFVSSDGMMGKIRVVAKGDDDGYNKKISFRNKLIRK